MTVGVNRQILPIVLFGLYRQDARLRRIEDRLDSLSDRMKSCEDTQKSSALDWDDIYDKCRHILGRVAKRKRVLDAEHAGSADSATEGNGAHQEVMSPSASAATILNQRYGGILRR